MEQLEEILERLWVSLEIDAQPGFKENSEVGPGTLEVRVSQLARPCWSLPPCLKRLSSWRLSWWWRKRFLSCYKTLEAFKRSRNFLFFLFWSGISGILPDSYRKLGIWSFFFPNSFAPVKKFISDRVWCCTSRWFWNWKSPVWLASCHSIAAMSWLPLSEGWNTCVPAIGLHLGLPVYPFSHKSDDTSGGPPFSTWEESGGRVTLRSIDTLALWPWSRFYFICHKTEKYLILYTLLSAWLDIFNKALRLLCLFGLVRTAGSYSWYRARRSGLSWSGVNGVNNSNDVWVSWKHRSTAVGRLIFVKSVDAAYRLKILPAPEYGTIKVSNLLVKDLL